MKITDLLAPVIGAMLVGCATVPASTTPEAIDFARYHAVKIEPVQFAPELADTLPEEERISLQRDFDAALREGLRADLRAEQASAGVMRVELTVTTLDASSPLVNVLSTALLFVPLDAGGITFDARFYDGESSTPFARGSYHHTSTPLELKGSFKRYGHATKSLREWAEELCTRTKEKAPDPADGVPTRAAARS